MNGRGSKPEVKADEWSKRHAGMCGTCEFAVFRSDWNLGGGTACTNRNSERYRCFVTNEDSCGHHADRKTRSRKPAAINPEFEQAVQEMITQSKLDAKRLKAKRDSQGECGSCAFHKFDFITQACFCRNPDSWMYNERRGNHEGCDEYQNRNKEGLTCSAR